MDDAAIKEQLAQIETSEGFARSRNLRKLLRYVVENEVKGEGDRLNGTRIAAEVFGRSAEQLTSESSLVRVEMSRLRRALAAYYQNHPAQTRIDIPKGSYQPRIVFDNVDTKARKTGFGIGVVILPIRNQSQPGDQVLADGVFGELNICLSRFGELKVVNGSGLGSESGEDRWAGLNEQLGCDYALSGNLIETDPQSVFQFELIRLNTREVVWGSSIKIDTKLAGLYNLVSDVAAKVASQIAKPAGVMLNTVLGQQHPTASVHQLGTECILMWHQYRLNFVDVSQHQELYNKLEAVLEEEPNFSMGWAMFSILTLDKYVFRLAPEEDAPEIRVKSRGYAERAISLDEFNPTAYFGLALTHYFSDDIAQFREAIYRGLEVNPNSTDLLHHGGTLLVMAGHREEGRSLLSDAGMVYHTSLIYRLGHIALAILDEDVQRAKTLVDPIDSSYYLSGSLVARNRGMPRW